MKKHKLFQSLNDIDEDIIEEAGQMKDFKKKKRFNPIEYLVPLVAVALIMIIVLPSLFNRDVPPAIDNNRLNLPKINIKSNIEQEYGFEGYRAYDIEEIVNGNPWNEDFAISELPVFKNKMFNENIKPEEDIDAMEKKLEDLIIALGINSKEIEVNEGNPIDKDIQVLRASNEQYDISVYSNLSAVISAPPTTELLKEYYITKKSSYEEIEETMEYLKQEYKDIITMGDPRANIFDGSYDVEDNRNFNISFFEGQAGLKEQIINYNFKNVGFSFSEEDKNITIYISNTDLSEKTGEYPIISSKDAEVLLVDNKYISSSPVQFPGSQYIKKIELVYRGESEEYFIPFYKFYVEVEDIKTLDKDIKFKTLATYYVPAVGEEHIEDFDKLDIKR